MTDSGRSPTRFEVNFSRPSLWGGFGAKPQPGWALMGQGEVVVNGASMTLKGRRPRPFRTSAKHEFSLQLQDVFNVIRDGRFIQCHVRVPYMKERVLQMWAADAPTAEQIVKLLPSERTPEFEKIVSEQDSFRIALQGLGTRVVVNPVIVALNCLVFAFMVYQGGGLFEPNAEVLTQWGTNYGPYTLEGQWWRLLSSTFLHFGLFHLLLNMWALWGMGQMAEKLFGSAHYLALYLFAGLGGSLASLYWHPAVNSAGASGAIFGVIGGLLAFVLNPQTRIPASVAASQRNGALVFVAYNLFNGFAHRGIDNAAHIGGLAGGFAIGWFLARPLEKESREDPAPRLLTVILGAAAVLTACWWPLKH